MQNLVLELFNVKFFLQFFFNKREEFLSVLFLFIKNLGS